MKLKKYGVTISWTSNEYWEVMAKDENHAETLAEKKRLAGKDATSYFETNEQTDVEECHE